MFNYSLRHLRWGCNSYLNHVSSLGTSECQGTEEGVQLPDLWYTQVIQVVQNNLQHNNCACIQHIKLVNQNFSKPTQNFQHYTANECVINYENYKEFVFLIDGTCITLTNIAKGAILSRCLSTSWYKISRDESVSSSKPLPKWVTKFPTISYKISIKY